MGDPIADLAAAQLPVGSVAPPPPPRRGKQRTQEWAERGIPGDPALARQRLAKSREKRKPRMITLTTTVRAKKTVLDAIAAIAERFDVSEGTVKTRFFEDGVRRYAADLAKEAGLVEPRMNPFDPLPTQQQPVPAQATEFYAHFPTAAPPTLPPIPPRTEFVLPMAGAPIGETMTTEQE